MNTSKPLKLNSKYILLLTVAYITAMFSSDAVAFKFVAANHLVTISGVTIIFPFTYLFGDVITEVYGYNIGRQVVWLSLISELVFALLITAIIHLPYPKYANYSNDFNLVFGDILRFVSSGVVANIVCSFLNIYLISKWKILLHGKVFWLRSVLSTAISELVLCGFAVLLGFTGRIPFDQALTMLGWTYLLELFYSIIFVWPAWWLSSYLKKVERIDAYDYNTNYNPFKFN